MSKRERFAYLLLILFAVALYLPINQVLTVGTSVRTALDAYVPIIPAFVIPYVLFLPYWLGFMLYATLKMDERLFRAFALSALFAALAATLTFLLFPTYVERPPLTGDGWATRALAFLYSSDNTFNAVPSEHTLYTTVIAVFASRWNPRLKGWMIASVVLVILATLFTGQHHLVDPLGGLLYAWLAIRFGDWVTQG